MSGVDMHFVHAAGSSLTRQGAERPRKMQRRFRAIIVVRIRKYRRACCLIAQVIFSLERLTVSLISWQIDVGLLYMRGVPLVTGEGVGLDEKYA